MNIGLLMVCGEDDILEATLAHNAQYVDCFYALDGTVPNLESREICEAHPKCAGYTRDADLSPERFGGRPRDGWRQHLYEQAAAEQGRVNWFLLLHGDEWWTDNPATLALDNHDAFVFQLTMFFPRAGEPWDERHPLEQLRWHLAPGYPEVRMFRGGSDVNYEPLQHFNVVPSGVGRIGTGFEIRHYLYRSPESQVARAAQHDLSGFDPDNYQHIKGGRVYWNEDTIAGYQKMSFWRELRCLTEPLSFSK